MLRGTIRLYSATQTEKIQTGWAKAAKLSDKLYILFHCSILESWEQFRSSPDAEELERGFNASGREEFALGHKRALKVLAEFFTPYTEALSRLDQTPESLADYIQVSISGIRYGAHSFDQVKSPVATLKASFLAILDEESAL